MSTAMGTESSEIAGLEPEADRAGAQHKGLSWLLMAGHLCTDLNQGALTAVFPFLVVSSGFSYTEVAFLVFASNAVSAVVQPLFGWLGDRRARPWLMALGMFLAGLGLAGVGILDSYPLIIASAMLSGLGVAMFHPEGGRLANLVAGERKGSGMSIFAVGGNLGFAVGPMLAVAGIAAFGLRGTFVFLIPATLCALVFLTKNRVFAGFGLVDKRVADDPGRRDRWDLFALVMAVLSSRSIIYYALTAYAALFIVAELGQTEAVGSSMITVFALFSAVATLLSGRIAGRVGVLRLMRGTYLVLAALLVCFALCRILPLSVLLLALIGLAQAVSYPSTVALGQSFVPRHLGMASGLSFGVVVCVGGMVSPILGAVGDAVGLTAVLLIVAGLALLACALSAVVARVAPQADVR